MSLCIGCTDYFLILTAQNAATSLSGKVSGMASGLQKDFCCQHTQLSCSFFLKRAGNQEGEWVVGVLCSAPRVHLALFKLSVICYGE